MTTLGFERGSSATTSYRRFERELETIIEMAKANGKIDDPSIRQRLMKAWAQRADHEGERLAFADCRAQRQA